MGIFTRKTNADEQATISDAVETLRSHLLETPGSFDSPEVEAGKFEESLRELEVPEERVPEAIASHAARQEAKLRAAMELAKWAEAFELLEVGWAPPAFSDLDPQNFCGRFGSALYGLAVAAPRDSRYQTMVGQGADPKNVRRLLLQRDITRQFNMGYEPDRSEFRLHVIADHFLMQNLIASFNYRTPIVPKGKDKKVGRILALTYGRIFYSWICWVQSHGLLQHISAMDPPPPDDPRVRGS